MSGSKEPGAADDDPNARRTEAMRLTPLSLPALTDAELQGPRRAGLAWQLWYDGEIRRTPVPLANGIVVLVDRPGVTVALRLDVDGRELWKIELPGLASGDPVRTQNFVAVPIGGERVVVIDVAEGRLLKHTVAVPGAPVRGGIAALGGRLWVRLGKSGDGLGPYLAVFDLMAPDDGLRLFPDPLGAAIEVRARRTNHTVVAAGEHPDGHATLVGIDESTARVLWEHELPRTGVVDLWAAGGLVDLVVSDGLRSWDARTGTPYTRRFGGQKLEGARLSGETLLVIVPEDDGSVRRLVAFEAATEELRGELSGVHRIVGASSDVVLMRDPEERTVLAELPTLLPLPLREVDAIEAASLAAFSRHAVWVVAHGGRSLSCLELPL